MGMRNLRKILNHSVTGATVAVLSSFLSINEAYAKPCLQSIQFASMDKEELKNKRPCSRDGRMYLFGLGIDPPMFETFKTEYDKDFGYYLLVRVYLNASKSFETKPVFSIGDFSFLVASQAALPTHSPNRFKASLYKMFFLAEYWHLNFKNKKIDGKMFKGLIEEFNSDVGVSNTKQLRCLILADVPDVSIQQIYDSPIYTDCMTWQKPILED